MLPGYGRLLAVAAGLHGGWYGYCRFVRDGASQGDVYIGPYGASSNFAVTQVILVQPGPVTLELQCKGAGDGFPAYFEDVQLSVVQIGSA